MVRATLRRSVPAVLVVLAACSGVARDDTLTPIAGDRLDRRVELPVYRPGDRFVFDDGRGMEVAAVDGDRVTWALRRGSTETRYRNFALPKVGWDHRKSSGSAEITVASDDLWPLEPGNSARFAQRLESTNKTTGKTRRYARVWECRVEAATWVAVPAGRFATYPIACERPTSGRSGIPTRIYRWYYAPAVGHYVRYDEYRRPRGGKRYASPRLVKTRRLAARGFGETLLTSVDPQLDRLVQTALEEHRSGERLEWRSEADEGQASVMPVGTIKRRDGTYCRDFTLDVTGHQQSWQHVGRACRRADGRWALAQPTRPGPPSAIGAFGERSGSG